MNLNMTPSYQGIQKELENQDQVRQILPIVKYLHFVVQEPQQNMTICPATAATAPMTRLRTTSPPTMPVLLIRMNSPKTILRNTTTSRLVPGTVF